MLSIKYITHACLFITIGKIKILVDPWLKGPSWGGNIWHFPKNHFSIKDFSKPDIIFFSHGHDDHFHLPTINEMPNSWKENCKIISANYGVENDWWLKELKKVRFKKIKLLKHLEELKINKNFSIKLFVNDQGETDCSLLLTYKNKKIFLQTDNVMSKKQAKLIVKKNKIDICFIMPFMTGSFPAFYRLRPNNPNLMIKGSQLKKINSLKYSSGITKILKPKYVIPYASDVAYMGENFYANLLNSSNKNEFKNFILKKKIKSKVKIMSPGDRLFWKNNKWKFNLSKYHFSYEDLNKFYYENVEHYDAINEEEKKYLKPDIAELRKIFIRKIKKYFLYNNPNINFLVIFKIKEGKNQIIKFKLSKKNISHKILKKINSKNNLIIEIESFRLRKMLRGDYPMQFLTFHNGGYHCIRSNLKLTEKEKKFWNWINFFSINI
tara:strand:+ start:10331 stop:11641 length:1311 start_codon:yes stop_codon:yes gene_type:complete